MKDYCKLDRKFVERKSHDYKDFVAAAARGKRIGWDDVLENKASVIIAAANAGKTMEMQQRALEEREAGRPASFLALRRLLTLDTLERALEGPSRTCYLAWRNSSTELLTLFVDSLDEAAATHRDNIEYLVGKLMNELGSARERVRWVFSTRPAIITPNFLPMLAQLLDVQYTVQVRSSNSEDGLVDSIAGVSDAKMASVVSTSASGLKVFRLMDLEADQAIRYLEETRRMSNSKSLIETAGERGLFGLCQTPGGLDVIARINLLDDPPRSLTEVFNRVAREVHKLRSDDKRLDDILGLNVQDLEDAAERIASASQICGLENIEIPVERSEISNDVLSAFHIAAPKLNQKAIEHLLSSQIFIDDSYHQVKMYPEC
ncbi:hypothetical protein J8I26_16660 [Herbaspirillum sp. LeCh32-8]|uniref:hypothetical protein n=1 Tax=Herbaspirillum sp. LeCh32-8 TaxID=2821356 RepID=UPI001AE9E0B3|nr:hypothetical protein [Herbaspirillum sp. LeCh32-8]MBP0599747.1 hypothetical protein [Herbaspirillum sp. LeCh32-8]